uniref:DsbC domain-containing protein n=1 Tax=Panagrellus redivivus TaxID=6233 RepID=A0A7E4UR94_PANRE
MSRLIILACVFLAGVIYTDAAVARMLVELGKEARFDFGENMLVVRRTTKLSPNSQYIFASPQQDGTWTTDGTDKIGKGAHLFFNGTLIIAKMTEEDIGSYEMPMETPRPNLARTMIDFALKDN